METSELLQLTSQTLILTLVLSLPPLLAAAFFGILVALIQALTQVQEQSLGFVVKVIAVFVTMLIMGGWAGLELFNFGLLVFQKIPFVK